MLSSIHNMSGRVRVHVREMGVIYTPVMSYLSAKDLDKSMKKQRDSDRYVVFFNDNMLQMSINPEYIIDINLETA